MPSFRRLTGIDLAISLRDTDLRTGRDLSRRSKILRAIRLVARNWRANSELHDITEWDTVRLWRYSTSMLATKHNVSFMEGDDFNRAYEASVRAAKRDHWNAGMHFRVHQAIWCARHGLNIGGNFVELGTGRGIIFTAILTSIADWESRSTQVFLFDTFSSSAMDFETGFQDSTKGTSPVYAESYESTKSSFKGWSRVNLVQGLLPHSLTQIDVGEIGFLHIDLNSHVVESECLKHLWPRLRKGAVVLLDDYAHVNSERQYVAINETAQHLGVSVLTLASGQGIIVKP